MFDLLLVLLAIHFLVLALHDIIPMGRWTDFDRLRRDNSAQRRWISALINGAVGFAPLYFAWHSRVAGPQAFGSAFWFLLFLFIGELLSWWRFYLFGASRETEERLARITDGTYTFATVRNGVTVNAFHCVLHALTLVCLVMTAVAWKV